MAVDGHVRGALKQLLKDEQYALAIQTDYRWSDQNLRIKP